MICSIFAIDANSGIGKDSTLPWPKDPEDLAWFKENTLGEIVVMGRNTWEDPLMPKPLPNRINAVVASKDFDQQNKVNLTIDNDLEKSLRNLNHYFYYRKIWIIGGAQLLKATTHLVQQVYLTRFDQSYDCDVIIDIDGYLSNFELVSEKQGTGKRFQIYHAKLPQST